MHRRNVPAPVVLVLALVPFAGACAPAQVRPGQDLAALQGERVAVEGQLSIPTHYAAGGADPGGWCLTLTRSRPQVRQRSDLAFGADVVPVHFRAGQAPPTEPTHARVVGVVAREGPGVVLREATWEAVK